MLLLTLAKGSSMGDVTYHWRQNLKEDILRGVLWLARCLVCVSFPDVLLAVDVTSQHKSGSGPRDAYSIFRPSTFHFFPAEAARWHEDKRHRCSDRPLAWHSEPQLVLLECVLSPPLLLPLPWIQRFPPLSTASHSSLCSRRRR